MKNFIASILKHSGLMLAAAGLLASCSASVDMPKGSRKGYTSAHLVERGPNARAITYTNERQIHGLIQKSIAKQFTSKGMAYGKSGSDLAVCYMVIYQEPGMTATYDQYFGYGRDSNKITDVAHTRGALENKRPDFFRQAGIVIDVVDARTGKLVYRNFAKGDVVKGASASTRAARIDVAVAQALAPFLQ